MERVKNLEKRRARKSNVLVARLLPSTTTVSARPSLGPWPLKRARGDWRLYGPQKNGAR